MNKGSYDLLIIGGGISACVFVSNLLKNKYKGNIALIEMGKRLGGRASTRIDNRFNDWELNHGSPNFNICNKVDNYLLQKFIKELLKNKFIRIDNSDVIKLTRNFISNSIENSEFLSGDNYSSSYSMSTLSKKIVDYRNLRSQIDFYFETLIVELDFYKNEWKLTSKDGDIFKSKFLIITSNLLLHKRSFKILNTNQIPLRKAIPKYKNKKIDELIDLLDEQKYIQRLSFLIYAARGYKYKDVYNKKNRYFYLKKDLENQYKFERIIFQFQNNKKLGLVIHSKSLDLIESYLKENNKEKIKQIVLKRFNELFDKNPYINKLSGDEDISIMRWRASQPLGKGAHLSLQFCKSYRIGFCGDWFAGQGFGRMEGAISSALNLSNKFKELS